MKNQVFKLFVCHAGWHVVHEKKSLKKLTDLEEQESMNNEFDPLWLQESTNLPLEIH